MANRISVAIWSVTALLLVLVVWLWLGAMPGAPTGTVRPDADSLERLSGYLKPAGPPGVVRGEVGWSGDAVDPFVARAAAPEGEPAATAGWRLSAILISPTRRVAIIDDRLVQPGDRLSGGTRVVDIQRDRVVLVEANGTRQVLRMKEGGDR